MYFTKGDLDTPVPLGAFYLECGERETIPEYNFHLVGMSHGVLVME